jgi:hypothetical protein
MKRWLTTQIDDQNRSFRRQMISIALFIAALQLCAIALLVRAFLLWIDAAAVSNGGLFSLPTVFAGSGESPMKSHLKLIAPNTENRTVTPKRRPRTRPWSWSLTGTA